MFCWPGRAVEDPLTYFEREEPGDTTSLSLGLVPFSSEIMDPLHMDTAQLSAVVGVANSTFSFGFFYSISEYFLGNYFFLLAYLVFLEISFSFLSCAFRLVLLY